MTCRLLYLDPNNSISDSDIDATFILAFARVDSLDEVVYTAAVDGLEDWHILDCVASGSSFID